MRIIKIASTKPTKDSLNLVLLTRKDNMRRRKLLGQELPISSPQLYKMESNFHRGLLKSWIVPRVSWKPIRYLREMG